MNNLLKFHKTNYELYVTILEKNSLIFGWRPVRFSILTDQLCFQFCFLRDRMDFNWFKWFEVTYNNGSYKFLSICLLKVLKIYMHYIPPAKVK